MGLKAQGPSCPLHVERGLLFQAHLPYLGTGDFWWQHWWLLHTLYTGSWLFPLASYVAPIKDDSCSRRPPSHPWSLEWWDKASRMEMTFRKAWYHNHSKAQMWYQEMIWPCLKIPFCIPWGIQGWREHCLTYWHHIWVFEQMWDHASPDVISTYCPTLSPRDARWQP